MPIEFAEFPKMARLSRRVIVTEKIDGTNAQIFIREGDGAGLEFGVDTQVTLNGVSLLIRAGSRSRWITPQDDNFGFARWVYDRAHELAELGPGQHFGEWWGAGIQRRYGLSEKRFSLFNAERWAEARPACCHVVPVLFDGLFTTEVVDWCIDALERDGSRAAPGFMEPEGAVVWHTAARVGFKKALEKDEMSKTEAGFRAKQPA